MGTHIEGAAQQTAYQKTLDDAIPNNLTAKKSPQIENFKLLFGTADGSVMEFYAEMFRHLTMTMA